MEMRSMSLLSNVVEATDCVYIMIIQDSFQQQIQTIFSFKRKKGVEKTLAWSEQLYNNINIMLCKCWEEQESSLSVSGRDKLDELTKQKREERKSAPFTVKMVKGLGLKQIILNNFLFHRSESKYKIQNKNNSKRLVLPQIKSEYVQKFDWIIDILESQQENISVPIIHVKRKNIQKYSRKKEATTIIYSHGNSSDLSDCLPFLLDLMNLRNVDIVVYDYTGYGASRKTEVSEESICRDLQAVLFWMKIPLSSIILWGFSLGSFPTIATASKYSVGGVILQSPLASISTFLDSNDDKYDCQLYDSDCLNNLQKIGDIRDCPIILFHSIDDEIIPVIHAHKLYQRYKKCNSFDNKMQFIEIQKIPHNLMHPFFVEKQGNQIQKYLFEFLDQLNSEKLRHKYKDTESSINEESIIVWNRSKKQLKCEKQVQRNENSEEEIEDQESICEKGIGETRNHHPNFSLLQ